MTRNKMILIVAIRMRLPTLVVLVRGRLDGVIAVEFQSLRHSLLQQGLKRNA